LPVGSANNHFSQTIPFVVAIDLHSLFSPQRSQHPDDIGVILSRQFEP
jgi:hypothetical protein